jgi:eukaryotic-like serine/threonine-protein kinase
MPAGPMDATAPYAAPSDEPMRTAPAASRPGSGFDEELRQLLRSRLILVHLLALILTLLLVVQLLLIPRRAPDSATRLYDSYWWCLAALSLESVIGVMVLRRFAGMSLRSLRLWELTFLVINAAYYGYDRYEKLSNLAGLAPSEMDMVGFRGLASLQGFVTLILAYGVLIPNTRRRSLVSVTALTVVPFTVLAAAAVVNPMLREDTFSPLLFQCAFVLLVPAAIAVFAASRSAALQRRAFDAERRAERIGQYVLKRKLGAGGMGEVWLAEHGLLKRPCAVKFVRSELAAHPAAAGRFAREVQAVTGLTHPNTVRVYDYGRAEDGSFYYVMEYLDGPTLEQLVRDSGPLPPGRVVYLLRQLCGALAEAHAAGLVHRDVKPGNVIVARLGGMCDVAKLLDFGLVLDESAAGGEDRLTWAGAVIGTPAYMPPEQAAGDPVGARGDVYALGAVGYYALSGRPPHGGATARQILAAVLTQPVPPLAGAPTDLAAVIARCLARDPSDRVATAWDLDRALAGCGCAADWSAELAVAACQAERQGKGSPDAETHTAG